jgi:nucleotide-binding universal stress UspA family protein
MKVLIAYDPDLNEPVPVADLKRAGFPAQCHALILAIADVLPPPAPADAGTTAPPVPARVQAAIDKAHQAAKGAQAQLQHEFPSWTIETDAVADAPAWGIIRKAEVWHADIIVVGAHRQSALSRLVLGSVSLKVLHEAPGTVRIVKRGTIDTYAAPRVLIGVDGSPDSDAAVAAVAARHWPSGTAVHVVAVVDPKIDSGPTPETRTVAARTRVEQIARQLANRGLTLTIEILDGDPKQALLAAAEAWNADCIFIGARGLSAVERILLGSVSATLAARATCSVEVVRRHQP